LSLAERDELNRQLKEAVEACSIRPSHSEFGSPILFEREVDGSPRLCIDYSGLNAVTRKDALPLPRVNDTMDELKDANFTRISTSRFAYGKFECMRRTSITTAFETLDGLMQ
jgi:hypothetical protein